MVFSSLLFLFRYLPVMLILYYAAPRRLRNGVLFLGSLFFYGWGEPVYISLMLFSSLVDYTHGLAISRMQQRGERNKARLAVASSAVINLSLLGFFKYSGFLTETLNGWLGTSIPVPELALPIGISFYTFQTMSYTIDVYRGDAKAQKNLVDFGAYVSMFPQLIAGPIVRYQDIAAELGSRRENPEEFALGAGRFAAGLGKKVLLANAAGAVWEEVCGMGAADRTVALVWLGLLAYGMQIYFDFSGYSDMAVGLGRMFGFHFPENFRYPYTARSITEFWRRWHISLGTWFKEYVYIPLGGSRKGPARQVVSILAVWILTGIWHGAGWNFLLWGLYFGLLLLGEKCVWGKYLQTWPRWAAVSAAQLLVFGGWVLFAHDSLADGLLYFRQMFGMEGLAFGSARTLYLIRDSLVLLAVCLFGCTPLPAALWRRICRRAEAQAPRLAGLLPAAGIAVLLVLCTADLVDAGYNPFLYFRF